jgi:hypothetical protein
MSQIQTGAGPDPSLSNIMLGEQTGTDPNDADEQATVKNVMQMFQKAKQFKANWSKNSERYWNLWESNHYKDRYSKTLTQAIVNVIFDSVETFVGHVSDGLPNPRAVPRSHENKDKAKIASKWLKFEVEQNNVEQEVQHPVRSACVTGAGWFAVEWDEKKSQGKGDVSIVPIDEKFIYVSPYARNLDEALYVIEAKNVPREYVARAWPEKGGDVPKGVRDANLSNLRGASSRGDAMAPDKALLTSTDGSTSHWSSASGENKSKQGDLVTLIKCYARQEDGTMRLTVVANGVLLQDGLSPYDDDDFPYAVVNVIPTLDTIQGRGLVQFVEGLQEILNTSLSALLDQQRFSSDPMLIVDTVNLEEGQLIDNTPGAVLPNSSQGRDGYYWLNAPGFNQAWVQIQEIISSYMDSVLGKVDVLKGERPVGVNTLGGLEIVRDQANVRLRNLIRWVKASLKRVYILTLSRLRQFATEERVMRITDDIGREDFVTANPVVGIGPDGKVEQDMTFGEDLEFDIEFGEDPLGGRQSKVELALSLAGTPAEDGLPMVDRKWVLEQAEVKEAPEIIERLTALQQQQAQAQMMAQGQGGSGAPQAEGGMPTEEDPMELLGRMFSV